MDGLEGVDLHSGTKDLDLIRVHRRVRDHDLCHTTTPSPYPYPTGKRAPLLGLP